MNQKIENYIVKFKIDLYNFEEITERLNHLLKQKLINFYFVTSDEEQDPEFVNVVCTDTEIIVNTLHFSGIYSFEIKHIGLIQKQNENIPLFSLN